MVEVRETKYMSHPKFEIQSGNVKTSIYIEQGEDLVVKQESPTGKEVSIQHYSNPGYLFYASLLDFLKRNHLKIPRPKNEEISGEFEKLHKENVKRAAMAVAPMRGPLPHVYLHYHDAGLNIEVTHAGVGTKNPQLVLTQLYGNKEKIVLDKHLVTELVKAIPKLYYPHYGFRALHDEFS